MGDAIKANATCTIDNRKKKTFKVARFQISFIKVVEVSFEEFEEELVRELSNERKYSQKKKVQNGRTKYI